LAESTGAGRSPAALLTLLLALPAQAGVYEVTSQTEVQAYDIRDYGCSPNPNTVCGNATNPTLLDRRVVAETIGLSGMELVKDEDLSFDSQLRLWTDFGITQTESQRLDSFPDSAAQLLFAYVTWRPDFFGGLFDVRVGRQFFADEFDFLDFDGAHLKLRIHPRGSRLGGSLEAFGGEQVTGTSYLASTVFQPDGTRETDARRLDDQMTTGTNLGALSYLSAPQFVVGGRANVNLWGIGDLRIGYQRSFSQGTDAYGMPATVIETEHAGASIRLYPIKGLNVYASADYDLILLQLTRGRAGATYTTRLFGITLEWQRIAPYFSSDSIWAYFAFAPRDDFRLRADLTPPDGIFRYFRYFIEVQNQRYRENLQPIVANDIAVSPYPCTTSSPSTCTPAIPSGVTLGGRAGIAWIPPNPWNPFRADADVSYTDGWGGRQFWANAHAGFDLNPFTVDLRGSAANVYDALNPMLFGTFAGMNLSAGLRIVSWAKLTVIVEDNFNPYTKQDFRLYGVLDVKYSQRIPL
jgi:hypothetical protein